MENIDSLIIDRLGEHQRKLDFVNKNINKQNRKGFPFKKISYTVLTVAACIAVLLFISPDLFHSNSISNISLTQPSFSEFRGSSQNDIQYLINSCLYEEALTSVSKNLEEINNEMQQLTSEEINKEEAIYLNTLYNEEKEELIWCQIYILVKMNNKNDIKDACQKYLSLSDFNKYRTEVENILERIQ